MSVPAGQEEVAAFLWRLSGADPVETHISLVFRGQDTVWKLKKAVRLPFLDFTTTEARRNYAERELTLNSGAAPGLYRDVVPVVRGPDGTLKLASGPGDDTAVDWVLRMARVPAGDFLDELAAAGRLDAALLDALADGVAAYHAQCLPARVEIAEVMRAVTTGNARSARAAGLPEADIATWETAELAALDRLADWQTERVRDGFVRRAHGDLHLGNLCLWHGRPVPFDALEFDETMATVDLGYDLAFLLMDLDQRAGRPAANRVLNRYVARTGDAAVTRALAPFLSQRAMVLAHVRTARGDPGAARGYLDAALAYLRPAPAMIVAVGGLQGTGKSTLARALAPEVGAAPGALILRSDETRKRLHGVRPEHRLPKSAYTEAATAEVFAALAAQAEQVAAAGHTVVADATFIDPAHRRALASAARRAGVPFMGMWMQAPLHVLAARLLARKDDASDATPAVLRASARAKTIPPRNWPALDATDAPTVLARAREIVRDAVVSPAAVLDAQRRPATSET